MKDQDDRPAPAAQLRRQAEEKARSVEPPGLEALSSEETQQILHGLRVHQIELEMQSEELRHAQMELDTAREHYFNLYDLAPVGYCTVSEQGLILEANLTAATLLGVVRSTLVKRPITRFILREDEDTFYLHRKQLFETGEPQAFELRLRREDPTPFWVRMEAVAAQDADGAPLCHVVMSDITDRKRAEAEVKVTQGKLLAEQRRGKRRLQKLNRELECRNRELQDFVQVASHDLRAPLVNIRGFGDMLASACDRARTAVAGTQDGASLRAELLPLLDEEIPESLGFIRDGSSKMDTLLSGLLNISRVGTAALNIEQLDMDQMVSEIVKSMAFSIEKAGAGVHISALPPCRGDAIQLGQVFSNLLDNALKCLDPNRSGVIRVTGVARVSARPRRNEVVYCVEDNGIGIEAKHQEAVFGLFHRLNDRWDGQGLGLTIVRRALDRQDGKIWLTSTPNQGSKFFVSLPAAFSR